MTEEKINPSKRRQDRKEKENGTLPFVTRKLQSARSLAYYWEGRARKMERQRNEWRLLLVFFTIIIIILVIVLLKRGI